MGGKGFVIRKTPLFYRNLQTGIQETGPLLDSPSTFLVYQSMGCLKKNQVLFHCLVTRMESLFPPLASLLPVDWPTKVCFMDSSEPYFLDLF